MSWQVVVPRLFDVIKNPKSEASQRAMNAMMKQKKINIAEIERAYAGK